MRPDHRVGMNLRSKGGLTILLLLLLVIWLLGGCSSPKTFDSWRKSATAVHVVRPGDTLYSIARANNIDYRQLARWNNIRDPNRIYVGQRIRLTPPPAGGSVVSTASASSHPASKSVSPSRQSVSPSRQSVSPSRQSVSPSRQSVSPSRQSVSPSRTSIKALASSRALARRSVKPAPSPSTASETDSVASVAWQWPATGKVLRTFNAADPSRRGIDIAGNLGDPVMAAGSGEVVYAGSGLPGYGNLLIIKHNQRYISAYAFNQSLLVEEGAKVTAGQRIATIGRDGNKPPALHFQIRIDGQPVDPLRFLPPR